MTAQQTHHLRHLVRRRFGKTTDTVLVPEHLVAFEVAVDGPPRYPDHPDLGRKRQRLDAVALGLWGKCEHRVHGFELKVSRADLLAELRQPEKAAAGVALCSTWSLVLGDPALLRDGDDLPAGWGVYAPHGRGLRQIVAPADQGVRDLPPRFAAALMQAALREPRYAFAMGQRAGHLAERRWWEAHNRRLGRAS